MKFLITLALAAVLVGCTASREQKLADTMWPQATIPAISKTETKERFLRALTSLGANLVDETSSSIKIYMPLSQGDAMMVNALVGSTRSEPPRDFLTLVFSEQQSGTFVLAQFWREVQQYNGTWKRIEMSNNTSYFNTYQKMLWDAKSKVESEGGLD